MDINPADLVFLHSMLAATIRGLQAEIIALHKEIERLHTLIPAADAAP